MNQIHKIKNNVKNQIIEMKNNVKNQISNVQINIYKIFEFMKSIQKIVNVRHENFIIEIINVKIKFNKNKIRRLHQFIVVITILRKNVKIIKHFRRNNELF